MYRAEKIDEALPGPKDEPIPEAQVFEQAGDAAEKDGRSDHPFFAGKREEEQARPITSMTCVRTTNTRDRRRTHLIWYL